MQAVILAGGLGTRLSELTDVRPKPMVEIGGKPILWHIMKIYSSHGIKDFIICCGYKGFLIKEYFVNYALHNSDITVSLKSNDITIHDNNSEDWRVTLVDTGEHSMTGGRLLRVKNHITSSTFCFTYGDGLSNVDITSLINFHKEHGKVATVTSVKPPGRYGALSINDSNIVENFIEKPSGDGGLINGGFFVLNTQVFNYLVDDLTIFETGPLVSLARNRELVSFFHNDFWQPMDTLREKNLLEELWNSNECPWKIW